MQAMFEALEPSLPRGQPIVMQAVHGIGLLEGAIAQGLGEIQARFPTVDLGSYPFRSEAGGGGVAIVGKGTDPAAIKAAIAEATQLITACGIEPVQGEPG
jgi:molybdopterin-biosynthesis enzyme MoeA-like protein